MVFALAGDSTITSVLAITTFLARKRGRLDQLLWGAITDYLNLRRLENGPGGVRHDPHPETRGGRAFCGGLGTEAARCPGEPPAWLRMVALPEEPGGPSTTTVCKVNIDSAAMTTRGGSPDRSQISSRWRAAVSSAANTACSGPASRSGIETASGPARMGPPSRSGKPLDEGFVFEAFSRPSASCGAGDRASTRRRQGPRRGRAVHRRDHLARARVTARAPSASSSAQPRPCSSHGACGTTQSGRPSRRAAAAVLRAPLWRPA